jgi:hypothetical protein
LTWKQFIILDILTGLCGAGLMSLGILISYVETGSLELWWSYLLIGFIFGVLYAPLHLAVYK